MYKIRIGVLCFDWNDAKDATNLRKHGIPFREAAGVFEDAHGQFFFDSAHSDVEDRYFLIGMSAKLSVLVVFHCWIDDFTVRIISARKASNHEKEEYRRRHAS